MFSNFFSWIYNPLRSGRVLTTTNTERSNLVEKVYFIHNSSSRSRNHISDATWYVASVFSSVLGESSKDIENSFIYSF